MATLQELIKDCDTELKQDILKIVENTGEELRITTEKGGVRQTSTIFLPKKLDWQQKYAALTALYGLTFYTEEVIFDKLPLEEQRRRVRALKVKCGKFNDLWSK